MKWSVDPVRWRGPRTRGQSFRVTPLYYIVVVIVDGQCICTKIYIYNCRKDEELVRILCS